MCQSIDIFLLHGIEIIGKISILVSALNSLCCQRRLKSQCLKHFIKEMLSRRCCLLREKYINQGWSVFSVCQQARAVSWWLASFVYSRFPCCTDKLSWAINYIFGQQGAVWHLCYCSLGLCIGCLDFNIQITRKYNTAYSVFKNYLADFVR